MILKKNTYEAYPLLKHHEHHVPYQFLHLQGIVQFASKHVWEVDGYALDFPWIP